MSVVQDHHNGSTASGELEEQKSSGGGYMGGITAQRTLTPGGHVANTDPIIAAASHRKIANPVPTAAFAFATTTLTLSLFNCGVQGIMLPQAVVGYALFYGGMVQYLGGLWEFAAGNTFGATVFVSYGAFWWGLAMLFIPFFNELASYDPTGLPGVYTAGGLGAKEADSAIGLFLFVWMGVTICLTLTTIRSSIMLLTLFLELDITFALLGAFYYTGNAKLQLAGGIMGCILAMNAYYVGAANLFTKGTSYFTLPAGSLAKKDA